MKLLLLCGLLGLGALVGSEARGAVIGVAPPVQIAHTDGEEATLAVPRWKGYMDPANPGRFWAMFCTSSSDATNIVFSENSGQSWHDTGMQAIQGGYLNFHASIFGHGGDIFVASNHGDGVRARHWAPPAESNDDRRELVEIPGTTSMHRTNTMVDGDGRWWVFTRYSYDADENVRYGYSDNQGVTWTHGMAVDTGAEDVRIGSMPGADGKPLLFVLYLQSDRAYEYYKWNGSQFVALPDHSIWSEYIGWERQFTHNIVGDYIHVIFRTGDSLQHVWKEHNGGQGTWHTDMVPTASSAELSPVTTVRGDELYLFYTLRTDDSNPASAVIRAIVWNQNTRSWGPEIAVSTGATTHNTHPNTCFNIPRTANYVPVFWNAAADGSDIMFSKLLVDSEATPVDDTPRGQVVLQPNYPNPFNPRTVIPFVIPRGGSVRLSVHDLGGRLVAVLIEGSLPSGRHEAVWEGLDQSGKSLPSGTYHVRLNVGDEVSARRVTLVR